MENIEYYQYINEQRQGDGARVCGISCLHTLQIQTPKTYMLWKKNFNRYCSATSYYDNLSSEC